MLSPVYPFPLNLGSKIRIFHILKELSKNNDITFLSFLDQKKEEIRINKEEHLNSEFITVQKLRSRAETVFRSLFSLKPYRVIKFQSDDYQKKVDLAIKNERFDIIWVNFLNMMSFLKPNQIRNSLVVVDRHNDDILYWESFVRQGAWYKRMYARQNLWKLRRFERKVIKNVDLVASVSDTDTQALKKRLGQSFQAWTLFNGIDIHYFHPPKKRDTEKKNIILFCGSLDITMNIDAVTRFTELIFPGIIKAVPDAEFWIVGRNPRLKVSRLAKYRNVLVAGDVSDVRPYYEKAKIVAAPFRFGGGTKLKLLEAMAMGVPVVSSPIGTQGIDTTDGYNIILADEPNKMKDLIIDLMTDNKKREEIARNARTLVEEKYSWEKVLANLNQRLSEHLLTTKRNRGF